MLLHNSAPGKANTQCLVNGTVYKLDGDACVEVEKQEDIDKLLSIPAWIDAAERSKLVAKAREKPIRLITSSGSLVKGQHGDPDYDKAQEPELAKSEATGKLYEKDPPVPEGDEEWPDPHDSMSLDYLKKMADAYGVKYNPQLKNKKVLVERILESMYE